MQVDILLIRREVVFLERRGGVVGHRAVVYVGLCRPEDVSNTASLAPVVVDQCNHGTLPLTENICQKIKCPFWTNLFGQS